MYMRGSAKFRAKFKREQAISPKTIRACMLDWEMTKNMIELKCNGPEASGRVSREERRIKLFS